MSNTHEATAVQSVYPKGKSEDLHIPSITAPKYHQSLEGIRAPRPTAFSAAVIRCAFA